MHESEVKLKANKVCVVVLSYSRKKNRGIIKSPTNYQVTKR